MTDQQTIPRHEIEEFLNGKPDTKLKKEILEMLQPEECKQKQFEQYTQNVYDLLCDALGKRRITIRPGKDRYGNLWGNESLNVGKFCVAFNISFGYEEQQHIEISHKDGGYSVVEVRVKPDNPDRYIDLAKTILDVLNGEK